MTTYQHYRRAERQLELRDYRGAAVTLERLLADLDRRGTGHGLHAARHLMARAFFHSAQLGRAEAAARGLLADDPTDGYAALLLARSLQRQSRHEEAAGALRLATALGAPGTTHDESQPTSENEDA